MSGPLPLRDYQLVDLSFMMTQPRTMLLHDPGGGKTPPVCVMIWFRWTQRERTIWTMPKSLLRKNKAELLRFTHFQPDDVAVVDGPKWKDTLTSTAKAFLMTPDRLHRSYAEIISAYPDIKMLVGDETHMYWANHEGKRVQSMYAAMKQIPFSVWMTGTLINGKLPTCFPAIHNIEPRYYGNYETFLNHHRILDEDKKIIGWADTERVARLIGRHSIRRSFESIYGKEEKVILPEYVDMSPAQEVAYRKFEQAGLLELDDRFLEAPNGGVAALRCRQILSHPETFGIADGELTGKDERLIIHLVDHLNTGKPLIIYSSFVAEQERIVKLCQRVGLTVALMNGNVSGDQRAHNSEEFISGNVQVIVGSPQVTAVGYNWAHVDHVIFVSLDYRDDSFVQGYRRAVRGIRATPLRITMLYYNDAYVEFRVAEIIEGKSRLANQVDPTREVLSIR